MEPAQQTAVLAGPVYFALFVAAGLASRNAARVSEKAGGDDAAAMWLWALLTAALGAIALLDRCDQRAGVLVAFLALYVLQNLWTPILTSRIYDAVDDRQGATFLSIESQAHRLVTIVLAPLFGWMVDRTSSLWPPFLLAASVAAGCTIASFLADRTRVR